MPPDRFNIRCIIQTAGKVALLGGLMLISTLALAQNSILPTSLNLGGASFATVETFTVTDQPFPSAQRISVNTLPPRPWDVLLGATTNAAVAKGDLLVATFYIRRGGPTTQADTPAFANAIFEQAVSPHLKSLFYSVECRGDWRRYSIPFIASRDLNANEAKFNFQLGMAKQTVEIGGVAVVNYGNKSLYTNTDPFGTFVFFGNSGGAIASNVTVTGEPGFTQAFRIQTITPPPSESMIRVASIVPTAVAAGDTLVAMFHLRSVGPTQDDARAGLLLAKASAPFTRSVMSYVSAGREWKEFIIPFKVLESSAANDLRFAINLSYQPQTVEIGGFQLVNLGNTVKHTDLSAMLDYPGREWNAPWRAAAEANIDLHRKAGLTVSLRNGLSQPLAAAAIRVEQTEHAFGFGTAINSWINGGGANSERYRSEVRQNFNKAVFEGWLKWTGWESNPSNAINGIQWLNDNGIWDIRSHALVWPSFGVTAKGFRKLPPDVDNLYGTALRDRILKHISGQPTLAPFSATDHPMVKGHVRDTDVLNEPFTNFDVQDRLNDYTVEYDWFHRARQGDARPRLFLNDYNVEGIFGNQNHQNYTLGRVRAIKNSGAPIDGVGFQSHFDTSMVGMDAFRNALDLFGAEVEHIQITEYDHEIGDRELQADFLRDYMTMAFSHPQVDAFLMWGFWDGAHWKDNAPLYDADWNLKPSGKAWFDLVYGKWWTNTSNAPVNTNASGNANARVFKGDHRLNITSGGVTKSYDTRLVTDRTVYPVFDPTAPALCGVDIGSPAVAGSTALNDVNGDVWTLTGSGVVWNNRDNFHFASKLMSGNGSLSVRVTSLSNTDSAAKAGLMIRNSLANDSSHVSLFATPNNSLRAQSRFLAGNPTVTNSSFATGTAAIPYWLKISRVGDVFTYYRSSDNINWFRIGAPVTVRMNDVVHVGIFHSSNNALLGAAKFTWLRIP